MNSKASRRLLLLQLAFAPFIKLGKLADDLVDLLFPRAKTPFTTVTIWEPPVPVLPEPAKLEGAFFIGNAVDNNRPIYALGPQLDRHFLIMGGTGCGKTTLIARFFTEEILKWQ